MKFKLHVIKNNIISRNLRAKIIHLDLWVKINLFYKSQYIDIDFSAHIIIKKLLREAAKII